MERRHANRPQPAVHIHPCGLHGGLKVEGVSMFKVGAVGFGAGVEDLSRPGLYEDMTPMARSWHQSLEVALTSLKDCVIVVDHERRILAATHAAQEMLARQEGLLLRAEHLCAQSRNDHRHLREVIETHSSDDLHIESSLCVQRPGRFPLHLRVRNIYREAGPDEIQADSSAIMVQITDVHASVIIEREPLRDLFQFTKREIEIAGCLSDGKTVGDCALALYISTATVRSHLKSMFVKSDTHTQVQFARVVLLAGR
jgi:DNA-binding NarL/FixJ family response regulator